MAEGNPDDDMRDFEERCRQYHHILKGDPKLAAMILYRSELVKSLDPLPLLDHMGLLLSAEKIQEIKCTFQTKSRISAARQLLDALLACEEPHLYQTFLTILREEGHENALGLMQGIRNIEKDAVFKDVIELLRPCIVKYLRVDYELLNALVVEGCISTETKDNIRSMKENISEAYAASALLDKVKMLIRDWPEGFVRALKESQNKMVLELLSPDFLEPSKSIEDVIDDMARSNPRPDDLPSDKSPGLGQEKAYGLMQGIRNIKKDDVFKDVIEILRRGIVKYLRVDFVLLNSLVAEGCISAETKNNILSIKENMSESAAASALLDKVQMLIRDWPEGFVRALKESQNEMVLELLSPDFLEPSKRIEDVIDDMARSNPRPNDLPSDESPGLAFGSLVQPSSLSSGNPETQINQSANNSGSGNFNVTNIGGNITINSTVNIQSPDSASLESNAGSSMERDVRAENLFYESSTSNGSSDVMDAPRRDNSIRRTTCDNQLSTGEAKEVNLPNSKRDSSISANGVSDSTLEEAGKLDEAEGGEKHEDEHNEKQDSESTKESDKDDLVLYDYQKILARPGIEGKNTIICAPTGSGKTIIAAGIMKDHLKKKPGKHKVIFLVCEVALANQQNKQFEKFLAPEFRSFVVSGAESGDKVPPIKLLLSDYDIIVMTAQLLVNGMVSPKVAKFDNKMDLVTFDDFSMMVFDECHHTGSDHPYNRIMTRYVDQKLETNQNLPQVLGLTASLGVGKASSMSKAIEHVVTMCANLDASELSNPDEEMMKQIQETSNRPTMKTTIAKSRNPDPFQDDISVIMTEIERRLRKSCEGEDKSFQQAFGSIPSEKGSQPYIQWISRIKKPIESSTTLTSVNRQRALKYLSYLKTYNRALLINHECRTRDALEYLKEEFQKIENVRIVDAEEDDFFDDDSKVDEKDEEQAWLEDRFKQLEPSLVAISMNPRYNNPMLASLKEKILEKFPDAQSKADGRGIIFVQTREMCTALCRWIREDEDLKDWNPEILVGANAKDPGPASMTQTKQLNILDYFKSGTHKLLVATSVAEEGLDIQKCNLIIRYNYVTNEIAMVQSRGRARAEDSTYEVLTGGTLGAKKAQKENLNKIREKMMIMAIETVKQMSKEVYEGHVRSYQKKFSKERKITEMARNKKKVFGNQKGPYFLLCRWCTKGLCQADELRLLAGMHNAVLSEGFKDKYRFKAAVKSKVIDEDMEFKGKITCSSCFQELGVFALYKNVPFPLLKVSNLLIENVVKDESNEPVSDEKGEPIMNRKGYKQWKDIPFIVQHLTDDELKAALRMRAVDGAKD